MRYQISWSTPVGQLLAIEPSRDEVRRHTAALTAAYNDPHNAPLLGHTERLTEADVAVHYASVAAAGGHNFLVLVDGALAGDADLRGVRGGFAEFAFLVAAVSAQGKGLGTRIAMMVSAFGFAQLALARIYASVVPANAASRRVFEKLGYTVDTSRAGRAYAEDPTDIVYAIDRVQFTQLHAAALAEILIGVR